MNKSCIILVKVLDSEVGDVRTQFLDMPMVNIIWKCPKPVCSFEGVIRQMCVLDYSAAVAFTSDTTNVMKGVQSGVQKLIKNDISTLYDVGCTCHLANLTIKAGLEELPIDIDKLFVDIYYYFYHSSKRHQEFDDLWRSLFSSDPGSIMKYCPTHWLRLLRCVDKYLKQLQGLISYFCTCSKQSSKVIDITTRLQLPFTKPILHFLLYVLPCMDRFNRLFQKSTENTTCEFYDEMNRLVKLYTAKILTNGTILDAGDELKLLNL